MNWNTISYIFFDNYDELSKRPEYEWLAQALFAGHAAQWERLDIFEKAKYISQVILKFPTSLETTKHLDSTVRNSRLSDWRFIFDHLLNGDNFSEPEKITIKTYKFTIQKFINKIDQILENNVTNYTLASLLTDYNETFVEKLKKRFSNLKPMNYAVLLFALEKLSLLKCSVSKFQNTTMLHKCLEATFNNVGSRPALSYNIKKLSKPNSSQKALITSMALEINAKLKE
ncbi:MAG: hypothetical protein KBH11_02540 [Bacteroidia bacterium]|nr:hypothetical protein [Bacteroidota bacterium]MBK8872979.1 hypothetical protein [Bacteroidota bacterium]MBP9081922.1 hypothetical protein [Bacteroidia bacterium]